LLVQQDASSVYLELITTLYLFVTNARQDIFSSMEVA
jgi:hypothetical protein